MTDVSTGSYAPVTQTAVSIVGGGPIGLALGVALQRQQIPFVIVEAGQLGHTMSWWAPQTRWFSSNERISIAGVPLLTSDQSKATREEYLTYLRTVATQFGIAVRTYEKVQDVQPSGDGWTLFSTRGEEAYRIDCRAVVLAIGGTDHPRRLDVAGESLPHVDSYLREPHRYYGRRVLIVGGRNSAVEAALRLHHAGAQVALSYRQTELPRESIKYWLWPELEGLMRSGAIASHLGTRATQITPQTVELEMVAGPRCGHRYDVAADEVLSLIGYEQDKSLFRKAGVELTDPGRRPRFDPETMETNVPGIFVAGTAIGGTQSSQYKVFLENCHAHSDRIVRRLRTRFPDLGCTPARSLRRERTVEGQLAAQIQSQPES